VPNRKFKVQSSKFKAKGAKSKVADSAAKTRRIQQQTYKSFRLSKRLKQPKAPILGSFRLFRLSVRQLIKNWRLFGGIVLVYLVLTVILVKGFGVSSNIGELKATLQDVFQGKTAQLTTSFTLFSVLLSNAGSAASEVAGAYQTMLLVITSLVLIWALRQVQAGKKAKIRVRDAFYKGLYPVVPFLLVLVVISLQLIPMIIASFLYSVVFTNGLAVTPIEQGLWALMLAVLVLLSLYMITSSIFALYIVTLPDMQPMQSLRSARDLVRHRRWTIMRKVLFLPFILLLISGVTMVPLIIVSPSVAEWLFFVMSMLSLAVVHGYMYGLYRELLKK
jgi:hypothetical protein